MTGPSAPRGQLVLVGTPIGNLGDLTPRARDALSAADVLCCEDTRRTRALLSAEGIRAPKLVSLHAHNEDERIPEVIEWVTAGRSVALVTDAGMPGISDPGTRLVASAAAAGIPVAVVPGPSSVLAALVLSGLPIDRFCVEGFLPRSGTARRVRLDALAAEQRTSVVLEAPARLAKTLADLRDSLGNRSVAVCRELTKLHEEVWRGRLDEAADAFAERSVRGEVTVVIEGASPPPPPDVADLVHALRLRLEEGDSPRAAAEAVSSALGVSRRRTYELAISLREEMRRGPG